MARNTPNAPFPESYIGPYYLPSQPVRRDTREDRPGVTLDLALTLINYKTWEPIHDASIHIWDADGLGNYSSFPKSTLIASTLETRNEKTYLRGIQFTNRKGKAGFKTIVPGWYPGRTPHIHLDIHGNKTKHSVQLYFPNSFIDKVSKKFPYTKNGYIRTRNNVDSLTDCLFLCMDGNKTTLKLRKTKNGYKASVLMGIGTTKITKKKPRTWEAKNGIKCQFYKPGGVLQLRCKRNVKIQDYLS